MFMAKPMGQSDTVRNNYGSCQPEIQSCRAFRAWARRSECISILRELFTCGLLKRTARGHFLWPLALVAPKNDSANIFRTITVEVLCTSGWNNKI
jgi:hypothetical protein